MPYRSNSTWNTPWWIPPSLRSTGTSKAQKGTSSQAIGRSKGGMTTKVLALTDALGNLVRFELLPGNRYDTIGVASLIDDIAFDALLGDNSFDANWIVEELDQRGAKVVISQLSGRSRQGQRHAADRKKLR